MKFFFSSSGCLEGPLQSRLCKGDKSPQLAVYLQPSNTALHAAGSAISTVVPICSILLTLLWSIMELLCAGCISAFIIVMSGFGYEITASSIISSDTLFEDCKEKMISTNENEIIPFDEGREMAFDCTDGTEIAGTKYRWLYNCQDELPSNSVLQSNGSKLVVINATFTRNPGLYTCIKGDKHGRKITKFHNRACLLPRMTPSISVDCSNVVVSNMGETANVLCDIVGSTGYYDTFDFQATISRKSGSSCTAYVGMDGIMQQTDNPCSLKIINDRYVCFGNASMPPTRDQLEASKLRFQFVYEIREIQHSDLGQYLVTIDSNEAKLNYEEVTITMSEVSTLRKTGIITSCAIAFAALSLIVTVLVSCFFRLEFRWVCWKLLHIGQSGEMSVSV